MIAAKQKRAIMGFVFVIVVCAAMLVLIFPESLSRFSQNQSLEILSVSERVREYDDAQIIVREKPFVGIGINQYVKELQNILTKLDVQSFNRLNNSDVNNPRRLMRRIEIASTTKKRTYIRSDLKRTDLPNTFIGLRYKDKSKLRQVIIKRVEERLKNGAIDEVKKLLKISYTENDPGLKTIGYQQIIKYLNKEITMEKAVEDWVNKEVQYAKRQLTFMKSDKNISWREI